MQLVKYLGLITAMTISGLAIALPDDLTPIGATKAANADGSIPSWEGGLTTTPEKFSGKYLVNPFDDDEPIATIKADNLAEHEKFLTEGQKQLLKTYPDSFEMPIYQTRRSAAYPQRIYDATAKNAKQAKLVNNGNGIEGTSQGFPFPIPEHGQHVMWNHNLRYFSDSGVSYKTNSAVVQSNGDYLLGTSFTDIAIYYNNPKFTAAKLKNRFVKVVGKILAPAKDAGQGFMVHVPLDRTIKETKAWIYTPGTRVKPVAEVGYDGTIHDGLVTHDQIAMFNGPLDRYNFKLIGKKEVYIPYNSYLLTDKSAKYKDIVQAGHPEPELTRYEKHRVWVVEATVKKGVNHIYAKRVFYIDEDSWSVVAQDIYDSRKQFWRYAEMHPIVQYQIPTVFAAMEAHYDIQSRRYVAVGMFSQEALPDFKYQPKERLYKPNGLKKYVNKR